MQLKFFQTSQICKYVRIPCETTRKEIYHRLNLAREFIHDSIETNFKVRDVARTIFVSEYSFIRQFKEVYHCTPYQYILKLKIERAKVLLKNENVSISDVAFRLGFSDLSSFGKCFHRWTGITPTQYRL